MKTIRVLFSVLAVLFVMTVAVGVGDCKTKAAEGTPISTAEEFLAMENNPSGNYYLTADITLPENTNMFTDGTPFSGTFDGNGHKIKGYTFIACGFYRAAIFSYARNATFKNITITNVNINIDTGDSVCWAAPLVAESLDCSFYNISTSGNIVITGDADQGDYIIGGICAMGASAKVMENCSSSVNISADVANYWNGIRIGGLASDGTFSKVNKCTYIGNINLKAAVGSDIVVFGIVSMAYKITNCKNSGNITANIGEPQLKGSRDLIFCGITTEGQTITKCENKGKITVKCDFAIGTASIAGVVGETCVVPEYYYKGPKRIAKCSNKGAITYVGGAGGIDTLIGGVVASSGKTIECYNKGKIYVKAGGHSTRVGGVCGETFGMKNCYNAGAVTQKGDGVTGGLAGSASLVGDKATCCYNVGKISGPTKANVGALFGIYDGADVVRKRNIYDNYYIGNVKKPYGTTGISWKEWVAKDTKVSAITTGSCPKLSSKKWVYSKKYKRLILKGNKEK